MAVAGSGMNAVKRLMVSMSSRRRNAELLGDMLRDCVVLSWRVRLRPGQHRELANEIAGTRCQLRLVFQVPKLVEHLLMNLPMISTKVRSRDVIYHPV